MNGTWKNPMIKWLIMKNKAFHSQVTERNLGSDVICFAKREFRMHQWKSLEKALCDYRSHLSKKFALFQAITMNDDFKLLKSIMNASYIWSTSFEYYKNPMKQECPICEYIVLLSQIFDSIHKTDLKDSSTNSPWLNLVPHGGRRLGSLYHKHLKSIIKMIHTTRALYSKPSEVIWIDVKESYPSSPCTCTCT